ncbi:peptidase P60 [bacterium endosymbiont of Escarpia laminata]|nr:MAG: peptidase P60 [bacterium endosymbiont of Escarpia laminata]
MSVTPDQVIAEARTWVGTPFGHQGRIKGRRVDCAGVIIGVARALGLSQFDSRDYGRSPNPERMGAILRSELIEIPVIDAEPGCVFWMAFDADPQHVAIYTGTNLIHAYSMAEKCVEHRMDSQLRTKIRAAFQFKKVDY